MAASKAASVVTLVCILYAPHFTLEHVAQVTSQARATLKEVCRDVWENISSSKNSGINRVATFFPREANHHAACARIRGVLFRGR